MRKNSQLTWLFDLDNTLHDASHAVFPAINANMNAYIAQLLRDAGQVADAAAVNAARVHYWQRYGATLLGLVRHHGVQPDHFLAHAHNFEDLPSMLRAERGLSRLLKRLPGRKILLTNAPREYSRAVLRHLGLHRHFVTHLPIESMIVHRQLRPKPSRALLAKIVARHKLNPRQAVLVEDSVENLKSARELGLRTAWVTRYLAPRGQAATRSHHVHRHAGRAAYVDVRVHSVTDLARRLSELR